MFVMFALFFVGGLAMGFTALSDAGYPESRVASFIAGFWSGFGLYVYLLIVMTVTDRLYPSGQFSFGVFLVIAGSFCSVWLGLLILLFRNVERIEANERRKAWARHDLETAEFLKKSH